MMFSKSPISICLILAAFLYGTHGKTIDDRKACGPGDVQPASRVNTTARLKAFRDAMTKINLQSFGNKRLKAFIVGSADAHNSEYTSEYDKRRMYVSGFGGSAGTAIITETKAALWTDGRYFLEADDVLDCNWILMKSGLPDTPSMKDWINSEMASDGQLVGVDPTLVTYEFFNTMAEELLKLSKRSVLTSVSHSNNPVDKIWSDRPKQPKNPVNALKLSFAGKSWEDKISDLRKEMKTKGADAFVVSSLDETAWLFNLRGSDIPYNPFFLSYAIVEPKRIRLYILDKDARLTAKPTDPESNETLAVHLGTSAKGACSGGTPCVEVVDYNQGQLVSDLTGISNNGKVWIPKAKASYAIYDAVQEKNRLLANSPIAVSKSIKNKIEREGFQRASNRDSAVLIKFLAFLEKEITNGKKWTEVTAATELGYRRCNATFSRGISFASISSFGSNGAVIHYQPSSKTDKVITDDSLYLLDSGGQYLEATTDVTRTMHYGKPTDYQKECYTRVLASTVDLATIRWPTGIFGRQLDSFARYQLWDAGLVYRHGTGHGIGAYLSVHEGPGFIGSSSKPVDTDYPLSAYQFFSDEPGYYEDGSFGIRLETLVMVAPFTPKYKKMGGKFLHFTPVTLVPFETKMMNMSMFTKRQVKWLNDYNKKIRSDILDLLSGDQLAIDWVMSRTGRITTYDGYLGQGANTITATAVFIISTIYSIFALLNN